jgi:glycosyltransferase involved in cell wall biosynthesis
VKTLYISYFGAMKPLVQTQVIPYLRQLAEAGVEVTLMTFEEALPDPNEEARRRAVIRSELEQAAIAWYPLRYHKRPSLLATGFDVAVGAVVGAFLVHRHKIDVLHARSHFAGVMALGIQRLLGTRILFDMRGSAAEEYVDAGRWRQGGIPYRLTKFAERELFRRSDAIVFLTRRIRTLLVQREPSLRRPDLHIEVIPCCADLARFSRADREKARAQLGLTDKNVLVYAGSTGSWYKMDEMVAFARVACERDRKFHFLILTHTPAPEIAAAMAKGAVHPDRFTVLRAEASEVPKYLSAADAAISFIQPCVSKIASSPTKIGEYLAAGLPVISNTGIGDLDEMISQERVGVLVARFNLADYEAALTSLALLRVEGPALAERCRATAKLQFSLDTVGRLGYLRVYEHLGLKQKGSTQIRSGVENEVGAIDMR